MGRPKKIKSQDYSISVKLGDITVEGQGTTMLAALENMTPPLKVIAKAFVTVRQGDRRYDHSLFPMQAKRLFHKIARISLAKNYELLLK